MLTELYIRNLAVIEHVHVTFRKGLQVLTGETGAGKSIIIDALGLVVGGRASSDSIRHGAEKAEVEASFELERGHPVWDVLRELGIEGEEDEPLIIRREITANGKSTARVNGRMVNLTMLKQIGEWLVNIHGQHEHQSLLKVERHLQLLDSFGDQTLKETLKKYEELYQTYRKLHAEWKELTEVNQQNLQMLDLYRFQKEEIEKAELTVGEDECLADEKRKLANAEKLFQAVSLGYESLYGQAGGLDAIGETMQRLESVAGVDPGQLEPLLEQIRSAYYQLEDAALQLRQYRDNIEFNPERLDEIERRLDLIASLRRKYGSTVEEILHYYERIVQKIGKMENKDERIAELENQLAPTRDKLRQAAEQLHTLRQKCAQKLAEQVERELADLNMERTRFQVKIEHEPEAFRLDGCDTVEFMIAPNPGEPLRPLGKIASGGELSRIMLALKTIFARTDRIPVLIFDEVDTGVSGRAAQAIADKLLAISGDCQVFAVTHLPQVACMADAHYVVQKEVQSDQTFTEVKELDEEARVQELARMLGGVEVTETTEDHAKEMLAMAARNKEQRNHLQ